jgi:hypothetical protein
MGALALMLQLFAVFFEAVHRAEIVSLSIKFPDDSLLFSYIDPADRISMCLCNGTQLFSRFRFSLFTGYQ